MAADIQHADALRLLKCLEQRILENPDFRMTYTDAAALLGREPGSSTRHVGQVCSRVDAACFYANLPWLSMSRVHKTEEGTINPASFAGDLWSVHKERLIQLAKRHRWTREDFGKIRWKLKSLGEDRAGASALWKRIEEFGERAVQKALAAGLVDA
jgi:hypothetical protein